MKYLSIMKSSPLLWKKFNYYNILIHYNKIYFNEIIPIVRKLLFHNGFLGFRMAFYFVMLFSSRITCVDQGRKGGAICVIDCSFIRHEERNSKYWESLGDVMLCRRWQRALRNIVGNRRRISGANDLKSLMITFRLIKSRNCIKRRHTRAQKKCSLSYCSIAV